MLANVSDVGPTLNQHCANSYLAELSFAQFLHKLEAVSGELDHVQVLLPEQVVVGTGVQTVAGDALYIHRVQSRPQGPGVRQGRRRRRRGLLTAHVGGVGRGVGWELLGDVRARVLSADGVVFCGNNSFIIIL